jgi:hypothetical protein
MVRRKDTRTDVYGSLPEMAPAIGAHSLRHKLSVKILRIERLERLHCDGIHIGKIARPV